MVFNSEVPYRIFRGEILTLGKRLRIYVLQNIWLFCTIYYLSPVQTVQVELGGARENVVTVTRWWTSKKAMAKFGICYLKQERHLFVDTAYRGWWHHKIEIQAKSLSHPPLCPIPYPTNTPSQMFFLPFPLLPPYHNLSCSLQLMSPLNLTHPLTFRLWPVPGYPTHDQQAERL